VQFLLRDAAWSLSSRFFVAGNTSGRTFLLASRPLPTPPRTAAVVIRKDMKQSLSINVVESLGPFLQVRASLTRNVTDSPRSGRLLFRALDRLFEKVIPVTSLPRLARNRAVSPVPQPASRMEPLIWSATSMKALCGLPCPKGPCLHTGFQKWLDQARRS